MKVVILISVFLLGLTAVNAGVIDTGLGVIGGTVNQLGKTVGDVGNTVSSWLGFGDKVTAIPWNDLTNYFDIVHGIKRIVGSPHCSCPYVYTGQYNRYPFLTQQGLIPGAINALGQVVGTATNVVSGIV